MGRSNSNSKLCSHEELPSWAKDNGFIITGYRRPGDADAVDDRTAEDDHIIATPLHEQRTGEARSLRNRKSEPTDKQRSNVVALFRHDTFQKCWQSVWGYAHNETVNIHTHLWGATGSAVILCLHILHHFEALPAVLRPLTHANIFLPQASGRHLISSTTKSSLSFPQVNSVFSVLDHSPNEWKDTVGFGIFLLAAITCLSLSTSFHTLACHSHAVAKRFNALDYVGIVVMIVGSFLPALHYGFYCRPDLQVTYALAIAALGSLATWTVVSPRYATPEFRPYRTAIFLSLGLSAVIPVAHGYFLYGYQTLRLTMGLDYLVLSGALYVAGALLYACRVPERFAPGRFDYLGASHQIFHTFILLAALAHYVCLRRAYTFWHASVRADGAAAALDREAICRLLS